MVYAHSAGVFRGRFPLPCRRVSSQAWTIHHTGGCFTYTSVIKLCHWKGPFKITWDNHDLSMILSDVFQCPRLITSVTQWVNMFHLSPSYIYSHVAWIWWTEKMCWWSPDLALGPSPIPFYVVKMGNHGKACHLHGFFEWNSATWLVLLIPHVCQECLKVLLYVYSWPFFCLVLKLH